MATQEYIEKQMAALTQADWQYIHMAVVDRFTKSDPKPGEPPASSAYKAEKARILGALLNKAY